MTRARDIADSTKTLSVDGGTIKLDGNYPVGTSNVALGDAAGAAITSGGRNTLIGGSAGDALTVGQRNVVIGTDALSADTQGSRSVAIGQAALANQNFTSATDNYNVAVGFQAGVNVSTGITNTMIGGFALYSNTTASNNTAVGYQATYSNTTGTGNTSLGYVSLFGNTTGNYNTVSGWGGLSSNTTGSNNAAFGYQSLNSNTTASNNTAVGYQAGYSNTTGRSNTFIGDAAGNASTSSFNTYIGKDAGKLITSGEGNTILGSYNGNQGGLDIRTSSNNIVLSDGDGNPAAYYNGDQIWEFYRHKIGDTFSYRIGTSENNVTNGGYLLNNSSGTGASAFIGHVTGASSGSRFVEYRYNNNEIGSITQSGTTGVSFNTSSDHRLKENVVELTGATDRLKQLNPSRFNFIAEPDRTVDGFLAHEVQTVVPEAIHGTHNEVDADGNPVYQGIDQSKLVPLLVATIKELEARITALEAV
jgi:hypothetical protein